ncbi:hypothetical protein Goshw_003242 [Gossypium schwendimanii]|uniref:Uncharacterized protein n=1 Tax=Gossypium schwendimanii TaxID=34291 RepID=A0A7J9KQK2_GOSSC|nr:hypothetical protein [Gossypium schwendimanii]
MDTDQTDPYKKKKKNRTRSSKR